MRMWSARQPDRAPHLPEKPPLTLTVTVPMDTPGSKGIPGYSRLLPAMLLFGCLTFPGPGRGKFCHLRGNSLESQL